MAFGVSRSLAAPLLLLNFCIYMIILGIAGWALNKAIDHGAGSFLAVSDNPATPYFVIFALIAGVVGIASTLSGLHHLRSWRHHSLSGSAAAAWIAWLLTLLALGLASKEIHKGGHRIKRMKALEAFVIIAAATQLLYLLAVHGGLFRGEYGDGEGYRGAPREAHKGTATV